MLKRYFSIGIKCDTNQRREKQIWQRRFWEHAIQDQEDLYRCMDYIHYNPVKHGYVRRTSDWQHSTFNHYVKLGYYHFDWGSEAEPKNIGLLKYE